MPTQIQISGTITSADGSGASTLASAGQTFTATITTDGLGSDLDASSGRGFFNLSNVSISLQLPGATLTTNQGSFEVTDAVSGADGLILAATTPFSWDGNSVGRLNFDFLSGVSTLFSSDQQAVDALTSNGFTSHRWLGLTVTSGSTWTYQGDISSVSVSAIPEPAATAAILALVVALVGFRARFRRAIS